MACDQDGGVVRCEAHLCPQYINNTSTCRVICTEYVLNTGRRPQTSERARKSPWNQAGQKGEKKARKKLGQDLYPHLGFPILCAERYLSISNPYLYQRQHAQWRHPALAILELLLSLQPHILGFFFFFNFFALNCSAIVSLLGSTQTATSSSSSRLNNRDLNYTRLCFVHQCRLGRFLFWFWFWF